MKNLLTAIAAILFVSTIGVAQNVIPKVNSCNYIDAAKLSSKDVCDPLLIIDPGIENREGYRLVIDGKGSRISASTEAGLFYGRQTLSQLCAADSVPCVDIEDAPRYGYRGIMLDPARHFIPIEDLKRYVDAISRYKYNVLHLHLSDDQGFRVQIDAYPLLTKVGSIRAETEGDGTPHQGFYTKSELADLVAYAAERHVEIIPEIDMPGHSVAAIAAYPWLTCRDTLLSVRTTPGVSKDLLCVGNERVFGVYDTIITELCAIFPSDKFHVGGDEAPLDHWTSCRKCQALKGREGLTTNQELMSYFFDRINQTLSKNGKKPLFWFELDVPHYPSGSTMYAWRSGLSPKTIVAARAGGYKIICAPGEHAYLDYPQFKGEIPARSSSWMPVITLEKVYQFNPSYDFTPEQSDHVIGVQATIWGEYTPTVKEIFERTFPRALALAEVGWSEMSVRNWDDFYRRAKSEEQYLKNNGINCTVF